MLWVYKLNTKLKLAIRRSIRFTNKRFRVREWKKTEKKKNNRETLYKIIPSHLTREMAHSILSTFVPFLSAKFQELSRKNDFTRAFVKGRFYCRWLFLFFSSFFSHSPGYDPFISIPKSNLLKSHGTCIFTYSIDRFLFCVGCMRAVVGLRYFVSKTK